MKIYDRIVKKHLRANLTQTLTIIVTITFATVVLFTALSLSVNYTAFFFSEAEDLLNLPMSQILKNNRSNLSEIGRYIGVFSVYFSNLTEGSSEEIPESDNSAAIFSPSGSVENLLTTNAALFILILIMVNASVSIVFRISRRSRRSFLTVLLAAGDTIKGVKKFVRKETLLYMYLSIPVGIVLGCIQLYIIKATGGLYFSRLGFSVFPVRINVSLIAMAVTVLLISAIVYRHSVKTYKNISIKNVGSDLKIKEAPNIGICVMTAKASKYQKKGMEHIIAIRNVHGNLGNYAGVLLMSCITTTILTFTVLAFNIIRNYNRGEIFTVGDGLYEFSYAYELFFLAVVIALAEITFIAVFCSVVANVNSNISEYSLMRSAGSSTKAVLRTVRKEGYVTAIITATVNLFFAGYAGVVVPRIYRNDPRVNFGDGRDIFLVVAAALLIIVVSIVFTGLMMSGKMKKLNIVSALKKLFY